MPSTASPMKTARYDADLLLFCSVQPETIDLSSFCFPFNLRNLSGQQKILSNYGRRGSTYNSTVARSFRQSRPNFLLGLFPSYYPCVFILKPGQHVHINKGRLHAFRKLTEKALPESDCHFELRQELLEKERFEKAPLCISIAWDWQYTGVNKQGINREVTSSLECQLLVDQKPDLKCLAIPKACLLALGHHCRTIKAQKKHPMFSVSNSNGSEHKELKNKNPVLVDHLLQGITPSLIYILEQNISFIEAAERKVREKKTPMGGYLSIAPFNDTSVNPLASTVDPDGNDYFCKLCNKELENVYLHCDGCEELLQKDFNICMDCYEGGGWRTKVDMHGGGLTRPICRTSSVNHTGDFRRWSSISSPCHCVQGSSCPRCNSCNGKKREWARFLCRRTRDHYLTHLASVSLQLYLP